MTHLYLWVLYQAKSLAPTIEGLISVFSEVATNQLQQSKRLL